MYCFQRASAPLERVEAHTLTCYWQSMLPSLVPGVLPSLERSIVGAIDRQLQAVQTGAVDWPCLEVGSGFLIGDLGCLGPGGPDPAGAWACHRRWAQPGARRAAEQPACSCACSTDLPRFSGTAHHLKVACSCACAEPRTAHHTEPSQHLPVMQSPAVEQCAVVVGGSPQNYAYCQPLLRGSSNLRMGWTLASDAKVRP